MVGDPRQNSWALALRGVGVLTASCACTQPRIGAGRWHFALWRLAELLGYYGPGTGRRAAGYRHPRRQFPDCLNATAAFP